MDYKVPRLVPLLVIARIRCRGATLALRARRITGQSRRHTGSSESCIGCESGTSRWPKNTHPPVILCQYRGEVAVFTVAPAARYRRPVAAEAGGPHPQASVYSHPARHRLQFTHRSEDRDLRRRPGLSFRAGSFAPPQKSPFCSPLNIHQLLDFPGPVWLSCATTLPAVTPGV